MTSHVKIFFGVLLFVLAVTLQILTVNSLAIEMTLRKCEDLDNERYRKIIENPLPHKNGLNRQEAKERHFTNSLVTTNDATCKEVQKIILKECRPGSTNDVCKLSIFDNITLDMYLVPNFSEANQEKIAMKVCAALDNSDECTAENENTHDEVSKRRSDPNCVFEKDRLFHIGRNYTITPQTFPSGSDKPLNLKVVIWKKNINENTPTTRKGCCRVIKMQKVTSRKNQNSSKRTRTH